MNMKMKMKISEMQSYLDKQFPLKKKEIKTNLHYKNKYTLLVALILSANSSDKQVPMQPIWDLQQTLGNQAVQRMMKSGIIQAKLKISHPNDVYEREADKVAEKIMRMASVSKEDKIEVPNDSLSRIQHKKCSNCQMKDRAKEGEGNPDFKISLQIKDCD